jgi:predicted glycosyltransferase
MSPAVLRSKVNTGTTTHHMTLAEASRVMGITGDHQILHPLAAEHGYVLVSAKGASDDDDLMSAVLSANAAEGELDQALQEALAGKVITRNEYKKLQVLAVKQNGVTLLLLPFFDRRPRRGGRLRESR